MKLSNQARTVVNSELNIESIQKKDEYIASLEKAVDNLQKELSRIRRSESLKLIDQTLENEPNEVWLQIIDDYKLPDSIFIEYTNKTHSIVKESSASSIKSEIIEKLIENGIIDFTLDNLISKVLPNIFDELSPTITLIPILQQSFQYIFVTRDSIAEIDFDELSSRLKLLCTNHLYNTYKAEVEEKSMIIDNLKSRIIDSVQSSTSNELLLALQSVEAFLTVAGSNTQLLIDGIGDLEMRLSLILKNIDKAKSIIINAKELNLINDTEDEKPINLVIKEIVELFISDMNQKNIEINIVDSFESRNVVMPNDKLKQVLESILENAIEAIEENGNISISSTYKRGNLVLTITDDGVGIDKSSFNRIFEPYFTTKSDRADRGYGLFLANSLVEKYNGTINVISELGKGSTFRVIIPILN